MRRKYGRRSVGFRILANSVNSILPSVAVKSLLMSDIILLFIKFFPFVVDVATYFPEPFVEMKSLIAFTSKKPLPSLSIFLNARFVEKPCKDSSSIFILSNVSCKSHSCFSKLLSTCSTWIWICEAGCVTLYEAVALNIVLSCGSTI